MKKSKMGLTLAVLLLCSMIGTMAFASVSDDQVTSQKIREADGTSGQNTNSGSGVKTGHIQNGAVTTSKIAVSAVTSSVIANGAVTSATIADGAVTDAKIAGPIAASKISSTGLNADTVDGQHASAFAPAVHAHPQSQVTGLEAALAGKADVLHNHDSLYQQKYGKVAVVAQTGGDYTNPITAMNDFQTWCGWPSAGNPCLIKMMPGVFDIGSNILELRPYVDLEGSGRNVTILSGNNGEWIGGVIRANASSEVRQLTVENRGGGQNAIGITGYYMGGSGSAKITNISVRIGGSNDTSRGIHSEGIEMAIENVDVAVAGNLNGYTPGIYCNWGSLKLKNVSINISGNIPGLSTGVGNFSGCQSITMSNIDIVSDGSGILINGTNTKISDATVVAGGAAIGVNGANVQVLKSVLSGASAVSCNSCIAKISLTQVNGSFPSDVKLFNCYDADFVPIPNQ